MFLNNLFSTINNPNVTKNFNIKLSKMYFWNFILELCSAATKIQASFRGHMQRKLQTPSTPDDVDIDEITKKVAEELDIDLTDPELNKAATKIQASFRGHKTRKTTDDK